MTREEELIQKLQPLVCSNCGFYKSEHSIWCPESGRTSRFKPGGYANIPTELLELILGGS